jgi:beta-aspartyl-peptidase (threonine type)
MSRPSLAFALAVLALPVLGSSLASCAGSVTSHRDQDQSDAMEAVLRTQESAWNRGDLERFVSEGYERTPKLTFFSGGEVSHGFDDLLARYQKRYKEGGREMGHLSFTELESLILATNAGIVRGRWRLEFQKDPAVGGLFTLVMERTPDGWRIVHDHTSVGEKKEPPKQP